ncbi:hypothetical protein QYE76_062387 [Lolium multiflorum]|uniref:Uncharacterized protein n=1 Tax=Lolium multiflorum TaxID=4521 RepID=A0AAD8W8D3_LOLMU|nr:hypothetical protein QYE76_062387 [Lolium multiflorum]
MKSNKKGMGEKHAPVALAGTRVCDSEWLYADADGILVSRTELIVSELCNKIALTNANNNLMPSKLEVGV